MDQKPLAATRIPLGDVVARGDALLVVPPFARLDLAHLGVHTLQACAQRHGFTVSVLYAGLFFAREIGEQAYHVLAESVTPHLLGERIFARAAYGVPLLGRRAAEALADVHLPAGIDPHELSRLALHAEGWLDRLAASIAELGFPVVGCSTMFEQTAASVAILTRVKRLAPATVTIAGGPNAFGEMAEGLAALAPAVDYVFSGESEAAFPAFLAGARPAGRVVAGEPCQDLDSLPTPDFGDFYRQRRLCLGTDPVAEERLLLPYETSRGCWWGQKHHCTFCGEAVMQYRQKSPPRVLEELKGLLAEHPSRRVFTTDDIMPHAYFKTLIPRLGEELPGLVMFYEQKANLTLEKVVALRRAGVSIVQPGIEALSSPLLARMDKGLLARQNVALLRYARSTLMSLIWAPLYGFPGDEPADYAHYPTLFPLLRHLEPPRFFSRLLLFRFSPYWKWPERYGITGLAPAPAYTDVLPDGADAAKIAYVFDGEYESVATRAPALVEAIRGAVTAWNTAWSASREAPPELSVSRSGADAYVLTDTRGLPGTRPVEIVSRGRAAAALVGRSLAALGDLASEVEWAVAAQCAVALDGWHVPLATAAPELLAELEGAYGHHADRRPEGGDPRRVRLATVSRT
jgi:ribosomal peptide maturation radical SAM protein 1